MIRSFGEASGTGRPVDPGAVADGFRAAAAQMGEPTPLLGSVCLYDIGLFDELDPATLADAHGDHAPGHADPPPAVRRTLDLGQLHHDRMWIQP